VTNPLSGDHALGLELQIEELVEQRERARLQGSAADADRLSAEITALHGALAAGVVQPAGEGVGSREGVTIEAEPAGLGAGDD
jgi:hypothetical protein